MTQVSKLHRDPAGQHMPAPGVRKAKKPKRERHAEYYGTVGHYLRTCRLRAGLTQIELARRFGITQIHLSQMENNKRAIDEAGAETLAEILDCDQRKLMSR